MRSAVLCLLVILALALVVTARQPSSNEALNPSELQLDHLLEKRIKMLNMNRKERSNERLVKKLLKVISEMKETTEQADEYIPPGCRRAGGLERLLEGKTIICERRR